MNDTTPHNHTVPKAITPIELEKLKSANRTQPLSYLSRCLMFLIGLVLIAMVATPQTITTITASDMPATATIILAMMLLLVLAFGVLELGTSAVRMYKKYKKASAQYKQIDNDDLKTMIHTGSLLPETIPFLRQIADQGRNPTFEEKWALDEYKQEATTRLTTLKWMKLKDGIDGVDEVLSELETESAHHKNAGIHYATQKSGVH